MEFRVWANYGPVAVWGPLSFFNSILEDIISQSVIK